MAVFKCKMCGGTIEFSSGATVGICDFCGTKQTLPRLDNEKKINLYDRASHFRRNNDFDKAMAVYEQILNEDGTDAEAYWSLVLCRYGIEYVDDPKTHKRIPTVNRAQFTSIFDDEDYESAIKYADIYQRAIYEEEAKEINEIQKGILSISAKEEPFDVFICYKETGEDGRRTHDSVYANELYHELTDEGFKVFFSRITLEDKLGIAYEPYIFAALHSARVMVVIGTKPEYFNAVWVKNEWSRFLALIKNGEKKVLIPAYRDMDPYDLPREFSHLQAQDMDKLGFMPDLIRGIRKIVSDIDDRDDKYVTGNYNAVGSSVDVDKLLKRAEIFLESCDWQNADIYCEKALDGDPENAQAYVFKLMAKFHVMSEVDLANVEEPLDDIMIYKNALRFADNETAARLQGYNAAVCERKAERDRLQREQEEREQEEARRREQLINEKRALAAARQQRKNELYVAKSAVETKLSSQIKSADSMFNTIWCKEKELNKIISDGKMRTLSIFTLLTSFIPLITLTVRGEVEESGMATVIFLVSLAANFILSICLLNAEKKPVGMWVLNLITIGIIGIVWACIGLIMSANGNYSNRKKEIETLKASFDNASREIARTRAELLEINDSIEALKAEDNE